MKLEKKRALAARTLGVGEKRIIFNSARLSEIKEAITKQDIKDLKTAGAILVREEKGRKKIVRRKTRRRSGSVRKVVKKTKRDYMALTRKLRKHLASLKSRGDLSIDKIKILRKEIRASVFRSLSHMKERISQLKEKE